MEKEQRNLKEWEIKYKKLEELYDKEKERVEAERTKARNEMSSLKKKANDMIGELDILKESHRKREMTWKEERENYEKNVVSLKEKLDNLQQAEANGKA